jgi:rhodanese-related sulfurtransferase
VNLVEAVARADLRGAPSAHEGSSPGAGVDLLLDQARARLHRLSPRAAYQAFLHGAELVDIRPAAQRAAEGEVPGALLVERNVLEWRLDPTSSARLPEASDYDLRVVVLCSEGYTSSLAAAALQEIGLRRATDVVGGFHAWRAAGLPTTEGDGRTTYASTGRVPGRRPAPLPGQPPVQIQQWQTCRRASV